MTIKISENSCHILHKKVWKCSFFSIHCLAEKTYHRPLVSECLNTGNNDFCIIYWNFRKPIETVFSFISMCFHIFWLLKQSSMAMKAFYSKNAWIDIFPFNYRFKMMKLLKTKDNELWIDIMGVLSQYYWNSWMKQNWEQLRYVSNRFITLMFK